MENADYVNEHAINDDLQGQYYVNTSAVTQTDQVTDTEQGAQETDAGTSSNGDEEIRHDESSEQVQIHDTGRPQDFDDQHEFDDLMIDENSEACHQSGHTYGETIENCEDLNDVQDLLDIGGTTEDYTYDAWDQFDDLVTGDID